MNKDALIQYYIQQEMEKQKNQVGGDSSLSKIKQLTNNASSLGNGLSTTGNILKDNINSEFAQKMGANMANLGGNISNGASAVSDTLNAPSNYFKGVANRAVGEGLSKIGSSLAGNSGAIGSIGQSLSNLGSSVAGTGAGAATAAGTTATAGTAAGAGAAGAAGAGTAAAGTGAAAAGPIGALVALGVMALQGTNRKRAKQGGEQLLNATNQMAQSRQKSNLEAAQQNSEALQQAAQQSLMNGTLTGYEPPVQNTEEVPDNFPMTKDAFAKSLYDNGWDENTVNAALEGRNLGNKEMDDYIKYYNSVAPQDQRLMAAQQAAAQQQEGNVVANDNVKTGLLNKFINGITDLSRGYAENRNTAFSPENLTQDKFAIKTNGQSQALTDYQNQLRGSGVDENIVNAVAQGKNSGIKDIANWISNNQSALNPVENTIYEDKSKMARVGEALGTVARTLNKPGVQGLVAGGLSAALTGDPLYGLGQGYKFANQRAMSDIYTNALRENGVEVSPGIFGNVDVKDMATLMTPKYKQMDNELKKVYYDALADYRSKMVENAKEKTEIAKEKNEIDKRYKEARIVNDTKRANAAVTRANNSGKGSGKAATKKPQDNPDWDNDLAGYYQILTNPRLAAKSGIARARFVQKYGVDPMKYVEL